MAKNDLVLVEKSDTALQIWNHFGRGREGSKRQWIQCGV